MSETSAAQVPQQPEGPALGVMDVVRMGWRLLASDFWQIWLAALIVVGIIGGVNYFPCISCVGPIINVFIWPALMAGLFLVVRNGIDGAPIQFGDLFSAFQRCYGQVLIGGLPVTLTGVVVWIAVTVIGMAMGFTMALTMENRGPDVELGPALASYGIGFGLSLIRLMIMGIVGLFFVFAMLAIWENPEDGWGAAKKSLRLVVDHLGSACIFGLIFAGLWVAAAVSGIAACCVGYFFTMAVFQAWHAASVVYLYRSWTSQALVQPLAALPAADAGLPPAPPAM